MRVDTCSFLFFFWYFFVFSLRFFERSDLFFFFGRSAKKKQKTNAFDCDPLVVFFSSFSFISFHFSFLLRALVCFKFHFFFQFFPFFVFLISFFSEKPMTRSAAYRRLLRPFPERGNLPLWVFTELSGGFTGFYLVSLGFTGFYCVLSSLI